jgi:hypothetical protein
MKHIAGALLAVLLYACVPCAAQPPADSPRATAIKAHLREILAAPEYRPEPSGSGLERVGRWIGDRLRALRDGLDRLLPSGLRVGAGASSILFWLILAALIVGLAYVIAYAARRAAMRAPFWKRGKPDIKAAPDLEETAAASPEEWLAAARRRAEAGDFRRAYRAVFVALLLRLDRAGAIRFERSRTNGEYLRALRGNPSMFAFLRPLAGDFDARWYGHLPVGEADYRRFMQAYERVASRES